MTELKLSKTEQHINVYQNGSFFFFHQIKFLNRAYAQIIRCVNYNYNFIQHT